MTENPISLSDWLAQYDGTVGLVFTDIIDSTSLIYAKKTVKYTGMLRSHKSRAVDMVRELGGRLIDETGEEIFAAFSTATNAYSFASELFNHPGNTDLRIRAGVHFGAVRAEGTALVGRNVHLGARVMQYAVDHELWVSDAAKSALEAESPSVASGISWLAGNECELKGIPDKQRLWRAA